MTTHDKPKARTIETAKWKVRLTPVLEKAPTGLASIGWNRSGWDVNVKIVNKETGEIVTDGRVGSLMWRKSGNCAWSIGSVDGMWAHANTLDAASAQGSSWSYKTDEFAFGRMCEFVKYNLEHGVTRLTRALA